MSGPKDSATAKASANMANNSPMDRSADSVSVRREDDSLGEMINSAAMSILDGEDFTMGPVPVKWVIVDKDKIWAVI